MSSREISEEDKRKLRRSAITELERLEECLKEGETIQLLDAFKNKFNVCETVYKVILAEHQKHKRAANTHLKIDMRQVPYALKFAGYDFDKALLDKLFGSDRSSAKKLRDAVTHGIDEDAKSEIVKRQEELLGLMDSFLSAIKGFDAAAG